MRLTPHVPEAAPTRAQDSTPIAAPSARRPSAHRIQTIPLDREQRVSSRLRVACSKRASGGAKAAQRQRKTTHHLRHYPTKTYVCRRLNIVSANLKYDVPSEAGLSRPRPIELSHYTRDSTPHPPISPITCATAPLNSPPSSSHFHFLSLILSLTYNPNPPHIPLSSLFH
jgi:hypothetical protein